MKVQKGSSVPTKVYVTTNTLKSGPNKTESKVVESVESTEVPEAALERVSNPESSDAHEEGTCSLFQFSHMSCFGFVFQSQEKMNFKATSHLILLSH